ncbi:trigger factor [Pseudothermotoga hypogea DSM 11164 = NBRC 106472]|uniref:Trigger factor n=1 Tax=Pseudothermotoga hypogea DSM 11164 = NBRC 106472 TaxID=1123384 RepID=A0A0X1KP40_9THEM|nr:MULTISPECIES: trigger factor [Pseudothermotoga]AJC73056.1 trigger factor [Pseudothermotoga hypogea DSM 11164 = NBRC 106472]MBC7122321.1 trigger factor [Pseudothermotoga sp.]MDI6862222.1 trigger factor [Pseudothermotoga sp.]
MERNVVNVDENVVTYEYLFNDEEKRAAESVALKKIARDVEVPGFRKGKVPEFILRARFPETLKAETLEELMSKVLEDLKQEDIILPVYPIDIDLEANGARLVVEVHRRPEVQLKPFEEFELKRIDKLSVLSKYVEDKLKELQEQHAIVQPKEGPAEYEDLVRVKMTISTNDKVLLDSKEIEYVLHKDDDRPIVTELIGKKAGEVVEFEKTFEDGKTYHYKIEILQLNSRTLPIVSDEFAKMVNSQYETLQQLREAIEKEASEMYDRDIKHFLRDQAIDVLIRTSELKISDKTLERLANRALEEIKSNRGEYERLLKEYDNDEEKAFEAIKRYYLQDLKVEYAIAEAVRQNNIEVSDEEIMAQAEKLALAWGISVERAKSLLKNRRDIYEEVRDELIKEKITDRILEKCKIFDVKPEEVNTNESGTDRAADTDGD